MAKRILFCPTESVGSYESSRSDFLAIFSDRAENLGEGLEAQVNKVDLEISGKNCLFLISYRW